MRFHTFFKRSTARRMSELGLTAYTLKQHQREAQPGCTHTHTKKKPSKNSHSATQCFKRPESAESFFELPSCMCCVRGCRRSFDPFNMSMNECLAKLHTAQQSRRGCSRCSEFAFLLCSVNLLFFSGECLCNSGDVNKVGIIVLPPSLISR